MYQLPRTMKHSLLALVFGVVVSFVSIGCRHSTEHRTVSSPRLELYFDKEHPGRSGHWKIVPFGSQPLPQGTGINLRVTGPNGSVDNLFSFVNQRDFKFIEEPPASAPVWRLESDGGVLELYRNTSGQEWSGEFQLRTNDPFDDLVFELSNERMSPVLWIWAIASKIEQTQLEPFSKIDADLSRGGLWNLIKHGVTADETESLLTSLPEGRIEDVIKLKRFGVSADQVRQFSPFGVESIIELRRFGVSAEYAAAFREFNPDYSASDIVTLRRFGVPSEWSLALRDLPKIQESSDLVNLRRYGVPTSLARTAHGFHFVKGANDIVSLRRQGVQGDFLKELKDVDPSETANGIIQLRRMGVSANYYNQLRRYGSYSIDDIILMRRNGVQPAFVASTFVPDKPALSARSIIELRNRGLSEQTIRELRQ